MILVINPGSTSTKIAVFSEKERVFSYTIRHETQDLYPFPEISDQYAFRLKLVLNCLQKAGYLLNGFSAVIARGGMLRPLPSGVYEVNEAMKEDLRSAVYGEHASNLGALIADEIVRMIPGARAFIADPVVVDEMQDIARIAGHPSFERKTTFHALNQKSVARTYARSIGRPYEELNLIVAHLGGGISVGAHCLGLVVDVNQALNGEGPFSPERSGTLPANQLVSMCFSGKYSQNEMMNMLSGSGGYLAYLGTTDAQVVEKKTAEGDAKFKLIRNAMIYQIAKEIGSCAVVLKGKADAILITGGIAYNTAFVDDLKEYVSFIAPVVVYPGEDEMEALAMDARLVLEKSLTPLTYI
jgi:butyrate kinase